ncbi:hypothetical protein [Paraburkholderia phosphatilytica]|uniref:hypothetical protein n=1 Tax=Paraburkholderia phosphatilytica TaxID=2282883 RepID=UPI000E4FA7FF|nr:hypothetical protein [Paraburkholderia phosphatilytica]
MTQARADGDLRIGPDGEVVTMSAEEMAAYIAATLRRTFLECPHPINRERATECAMVVSHHFYLPVRPYFVLTVHLQESYGPSTG